MKRCLFYIIYDKYFIRCFRSIIGLSELQKEKTHRLRINLECDVGKTELFILLTITGTSLVNTLVDLDDYEATKQLLSSVKKKYVRMYLFGKFIYMFSPLCLIVGHGFTSFFNLISGLVSC